MTEPIRTPERSQSALRGVGERALLEGMLDWYRDGVVLKVQGLDDASAAASPVPSGNSVSGLVRHLAAVEDGWFWVHLGGNPDPAPWDTAPWDVDPDWEWRVAREEPLEASVALYRTAIARSREVCAGLDLETKGTTHSGQEFSLRYAYVHMIEETARHLGHLDILREMADSTIGD